MLDDFQRWRGWGPGCEIQHRFHGTCQNTTTKKMCVVDIVILTFLGGTTGRFACKNSVTMKAMKSLKAAPPQNPFLSSAFLHVLHALHGPCFPKSAFEVAHLAAGGIAFTYS